MLQRSHGSTRYPDSKLIASSAELGWPSMLAELRSHSASVIPMVLQQHVEIWIAIAGNGQALVNRSRAGKVEQATADTGSIWICPIGVDSGETSITSPVPEMLHLYLTSSLFDRLTEEFELAVSPVHSVRCVAAIRDDVIYQIGRSIVAELMEETAAGRVYAEAVAVALVARLAQKYCGHGLQSFGQLAAPGLDAIRRRRVLDFIEANIEQDISLADLADAADYSLFHFARKFKASLGVTPHRYLSERRLERAMVQLASAKLPLAEIALNANFSSQASFTRAFHRATGITPKEYQRRRA